MIEQVRPGKQVKILCEPVAVRRRTYSYPDWKPHSGKRHWNISEKAGGESAKPKYPDKAFPFDCRERRLLGK